MIHEHLVLRVVSKLLITPIVLYALYVQFHGDFGPGGGFQAGVIFGVGFILYGLVFGLTPMQRVMPPPLMRTLVAVGVLIYAATGLSAVFVDHRFLDYSMLSHDPVHGQELGIFLVELGVGITVSAVMISIFSSFAAHTPRTRDEDW